MLRYPTILSPDFRAAVTVPGSVLISRQPGGYDRLASPDGRGLVLHADGVGIGCTQAKAAGFASAGGPEVSEGSEEPQAATVAALTRASAATRIQLRNGRLDVAVAIAGAAVVVCVVIPAVVLGDPVMVMMVVMVVVSRHSDSGAADRDGQRGNSGHEPPACPVEH
jgi:hypothetical protein